MSPSPNQRGARFSARVLRRQTRLRRVRHRLRTISGRTIRRAGKSGFVLRLQPAGQHRRQPFLQVTLCGARQLPSPYDLAALVGNTLAEYGEVHEVRRRTAGVANAIRSTARKRSFLRPTRYPPTRSSSRSCAGNDSPTTYRAHCPHSLRGETFFFRPCSRSCDWQG